MGLAATWNRPAAHPEESARPAAQAPVAKAAVLEVPAAASLVAVTRAAEPAGHPAAAPVKVAQPGWPAAEAQWAAPLVKVAQAARPAAQARLS
jgi:hypothetical protein